jgi:hypothetical protein
LKQGRLRSNIDALVGGHAGRRCQVICSGNLFWKLLDKVLDEGAAKRWTIVDTKRDWNHVFAFEP